MAERARPATRTEARAARAARGGAVRDPARDRRPGGDARAAARLPARRRPPADRGRAGPRQDARDQVDRGSVLGGSFARIQFTPDLVPSDLVGTRDLPSRPARVRDRARPGLLQLPARRRDQPRPRQGAVGAARGDAGAPGDDRPHDPPGARPVPRARDAEPDRVGGHLPAARGAGRPLHAQGARRLPDPRRGADRRRALARAAAEALARCSRSTTCARCRRWSGKVFVDPALDQLGRRPRDRDAQAGRARRRADRALHLLRGQPARPDQRHRGRPRARGAARPRLRAAGRRRGGRPRRLPPPARPLLPGARGGGHRRPGARRGAGRRRRRRRSTSAGPPTAAA